MIVNCQTRMFPDLGPQVQQRVAHSYGCCSRKEKASATPVQPVDDKLRYPAADGEEEVTIGILPTTTTTTTTTTDAGCHSEDKSGNGE